MLVYALLGEKQIKDGKQRHFGNNGLLCGSSRWQKNRNEGNQYERLSY